MITTKEISITPKLFFHIWIQHVWKIMLALIAIVIFHSILGFAQFNNFQDFIADITKNYWQSKIIKVFLIMILELFGPLLIIIPTKIILRIIATYFFYRSQKSKKIFQPFILKITDEEITKIDKDTLSSSHLINNIISLRKNNQYYILRLLGQKILVIPYNAFASETDKEQFEKILETSFQRNTQQKRTICYIWGFIALLPTLLLGYVNIWSYPGGGNVTLLNEARATLFMVISWLSLGCAIYFFSLAREFVKKNHQYKFYGTLLFLLVLIIATYLIDHFYLQIFLGLDNWCC